MMRYRLERRSTAAPLWLNLALPFVAVLAALALCAILIALAGANPLTAYATLFGTALGSKFYLAETFVKAAPLVFTGLAVAIAFRVRFWNIGAPGQLVAGAVAAGLVGGLAGVPGPLLIVLMLIAGAVAGGLVALVPALLRVRLQVDDVVSSLLFNFVVIYFMRALIEGPWKNAKTGYPISPPIQEVAHFPIIIPGTRAHLGVLLAFIAVPLIWFVVRKTTFGFRMTVVGENPHAARYAGISSGGVMLATALVSGALAGLAGVGQVAGVHYQVMAGIGGGTSITAGYGYTGIVVATLARLNPLAVAPAALFLATTMTGSYAMSRVTGVPVYLSGVIQGATLISILIAMLFMNYRLRRVGDRHA